MNILIIKHGALGDVLRTSFFFEDLNKKGFSIYLLSMDGELVIGKSPFVRRVFKDVHSIIKTNISIDFIFSLEDDLQYIGDAMKLKEHLNCELRGLSLNQKNFVNYCDLSSAWNDMGIHSRYGLEHANLLKKSNKSQFSDLLRELFFNSDFKPNIFLTNAEIVQHHSYGMVKKVAFAPFGGARWKGKSMATEVVISVCEDLMKSGYDVKIYGSLQDVDEKIEKHHCPTASIDDLKTELSKCDVLIGADSLIAHIAAGLNLPSLIFFGPTSAQEFNGPEICKKVIANEEGYCGYDKDMKFPSINKKTILKHFTNLLSDIEGLEGHEK